MTRKMTKETQALSQEKCITILERNTHGILSLNGDDGYPYGVPINYVYCDGKIYFHSTIAGYKVDCMAKNPKVSFAVVDQNEINQEGFTASFRSVIARGTVSITDEAEHRKGFIAFVDKYSPSVNEELRHYMIDNCGCGPNHVYAIAIEELTGKRSANQVEQKCGCCCG